MSERIVPVLRKDVEITAGNLQEPAACGAFCQMRLSSRFLDGGEVPFLKVRQNFSKVTAIHISSNNRVAGRLAPQKGELVRQLDPRAIGSRLDRSQWHIDHEGDFFQCKALEIL